MWRVEQANNDNRLAFLSVAWGLIADMDVGSEHLRCVRNAFPVDCLTMNTDH